MKSLSSRSLIKTACFMVAYFNYLYDKFLPLYVISLITIYSISILEIGVYKNYKINQSIIYGIVLILIIPFITLSIPLSALCVVLVMIISLSYILAF